MNKSKPRYDNRLGERKIGSPNKHSVYSITFPSHLIEKTNWKKGDSIGFFLSENKEKTRQNFELINLTREQRPYADMTFIRLAKEHGKIIKNKMPRNLKNYSKDIQEFLLGNKGLTKFKSGFSQNVEIDPRREQIEFTKKAINEKMKNDRRNKLEIKKDANEFIRLIIEEPDKAIERIRKSGERQIKEINDSLNESKESLGKLKSP
jgi:hypothetical protein